MLDRRTAAVAAIWICHVVAPAGAGAQRTAGDGFMFGAPGASFALRAGLARPTAGSDVFSFAREHLTLGHRDFVGGSISGDLAIHVSERVAVQVSAGYSSRTSASEFRDWVDNNDLPIEQSSVFRRAPITVGLRYYLAPPGRSLGRLAWVPTPLVPYISAGAGGVWYKFRQSGDFVDFQTLDVFSSDLESSSWAPAVHGAAGLDYALSAKVGLVTEARYDRASARMQSDFSGFDRIDLSGFTVTLGLSFRF